MTTRPPRRLATRSAALARAGFTDTEAAERELDALPSEVHEPEQNLLALLARVADPDLAVRNLGRLLDALPPGSDRDVLLHGVRTGNDAALRTLAVLGFSTALADHLVRHPDDLHELFVATADSLAGPEELRARILRTVGADPASSTPEARGDYGVLIDSLRIAYRRQLLGLAALDLTAGLEIPTVGTQLSDLAGAVLEAALAVARAQLPESASPCRLAVIGMGKCGGRELNYVSDVDVMFVAEPAIEAASHDQKDAHDSDATDAALHTAAVLATTVMRACSERTAEGTIWPVDAALRPEGKAGPLVRSQASYLKYYETWAKTWEFQALLKARPVAGDRELGEEFVAATQPLVWNASGRDGFVADVQGMRQRVESHIRPKEAERELKLGPGGLRDVEFAVQLLQLVHGRTDEGLRSATTLDALAALTDGGYVGRDDGAVLDRAYRYLRTLEHRIQLRGLRRTHVMPEVPGELRALGRSLALRDVDELTERWRRETREVRRLHEKLFYRPLLSAVASLPTEGVRLSPEAALARLEALGYTDPAGALRHIEALTRGVSRRSAIQRTLLPVLLAWFADGPQPDAGLSGFRRVSEALGETPWYLRLLRDDGLAAERMARVLASGRYTTELLMRAPEAVAMLAGDSELVPRGRAQLEAEVTAGVERHDEPVDAIGVVRAMRRRESFRTAVADLVDLLGVREVGESLTVIAESVLAGALSVAVRAVEQERREELPTRFAVISMGRLGGREMGYASDADVLFLHMPHPGVSDEVATKAATAVANEMRRLLALPSPEPAFTIDAGLRPEGRQGPLVRTLPSYAAYYERWAEVWERQALLRAAPCCGDPELLRRFEALIDPVRWPARGLTEAQVREVRRIKARVESERLPRGADPSTHLKLGPGGLADVEWCVQLLQLRHAGDVPELRTTATLDVLDAAVDAGLMSTSDQRVLRDAWWQASAIRNATVLVTGRPSDQIPADPETLAAVSRVMGHGPGESAAFLDGYRRTSRRARAVFERIFYGN
ncbi:bifunctional [glutamine synthetase] adenylyltransferase/[glutamine synthetase]-adenylyl-L-tyrosine phosphorylase [Actinobacteria bacterium YIM 96077]|uniref:Bifunctional glutamine synthetase adenylyltransferase/adenylyl-removing enzyme n=1 Tax=Phytoactinopolyspora halophila TaxID=1981511 RepID=A0A329QGN2_9ACTN|nr:bifunctional [glutamine synthetase] adenylyltransferase/[glutamine synthetase]-adenylyl-L-tyrosine phosphorylase [Phytoactinopolyspora halophila]AYY13737.1 bifunctional [glutamine synthetase] adenylyltransferase/[glutamine synthetase]-adenylyl-L-tyrosine phosphorylase [Actinobacteria bacterium YIM 96077]RAW09468.1 bifunctional [glutamine synthetase] adenylyltransferase/[glutamine synthetase]-adenylyl-L-tyrosine phosphorylase [Phytoactinopolyspora halophila]